MSTDDGNADDTRLHVEYQRIFQMGSHAVRTLNYEIARDVNEYILDLKKKLAEAFETIILRTQTTPQCMIKVNNVSCNKDLSVVLHMDTEYGKCSMKVSKADNPKSVKELKRYIRHNDVYINCTMMNMYLSPVEDPFNPTVLAGTIVVSRNMPVNLPDNLMHFVSYLSKRLKRDTYYYGCIPRHVIPSSVMVKMARFEYYLHQATKTPLCYCNIGLPPPELVHALIRSNKNSLFRIDRSHCLEVNDEYRLVRLPSRQKQTKSATKTGTQSKLISKNGDIGDATSSNTDDSVTKPKQDM